MSVNVPSGVKHSTQPLTSSFSATSYALRMISSLFIGDSSLFDGFKSGARGRDERQPRSPPGAETALEGQCTVEAPALEPPGRLRRADIARAVAHEHEVVVDRRRRDQRQQLARRELDGAREREAVLVVVATTAQVHDARRVAALQALIQLGRGDVRPRKVPPRAVPADQPLREKRDHRHGHDQGSEARRQRDQALSPLDLPPDQGAQEQIGARPEGGPRGLEHREAGVPHRRLPSGRSYHQPDAGNELGDEQELRAVAGDRVAGGADAGGRLQRYPAEEAEHGVAASASEREPGAVGEQASQDHHRGGRHRREPSVCHERARDEQHRRRRDGHPALGCEDVREQGRVSVLEEEGKRGAHDGLYEASSAPAASAVTANWLSPARRAFRRPIATTITIHAATSAMFRTANARVDTLARLAAHTNRAVSASPARTTTVSVTVLPMYFSAREAWRKRACRAVFCTEYSSALSPTFVARSTESTGAARNAPYSKNATTGRTSSAPRTPTRAMMRETANAWSTSPVMLTHSK